jgi:hypothetical protein
MQNDFVDMDLTGQTESLLFTIQKPAVVYRAKIGSESKMKSNSAMCEKVCAMSLHRFFRYVFSPAPSKCTFTAVVLNVLESSPFMLTIIKSSTKESDRALKLNCKR